ncbi:hypothetical protein CKA32_004481 [Geitlerinema sp. FC II]|nr:hypothetical protein CKA32_004481 [Geitlerinema sp. FC II]
MVLVKIHQYNHQLPLTLTISDSHNRRHEFFGFANWQELPRDELAVSVFRGSRPERSLSHKKD